ncbi:MAG: GNAT family N-acetyltransferase [Anaerolineales bacterium]|nr:GNAT family N-acetyltransferase [Anaerolineales bacterium]
MPEIEIRPAFSSDIPHLIALGHNYTTGYVWQMTRDITENQTQIAFREVRLPREVHVNYPRNPQLLADTWTEKDALLLAKGIDDFKGYISLQLNNSPASAWVENLVVDRDLRRKGIGTALITAAKEWCQKKGVSRLTLEMQPKNYPAIQLAKKMGFEFSGYNDQYYRRQEIAIFFSAFL